ncbi:hypothetical protein BFJ69_g7988 [Fusarium oxysporum]|uniref:Uncharacterized protein n=1 Tax=Fusarium oxysporum TaxID=5507 RepID=A0A420N424_FUSOX|nr:hypothetical protein BFJ69_g7988 [Fusarium oxysporum]
MGMCNGQEEHDNLVWDKNDEDFEAAQQQLRLKTFCRKVEGFVQQKFGKPATLVSPLIIGGSNILHRVRVEDMSPDVMVRVPCPSLVHFPVEKTMNEAATASFLVSQTQLPIPSPLFFGKDPDDERAAMEPFVQRKLADSKDRLIVEWDETEAQKRFSELLFN